MIQFRLGAWYRAASLAGLGVVNARVAISESGRFLYVAQGRARAVLQVQEWAFNATTDTLEATAELTTHVRKQSVTTVHTVRYSLLDYL